MGCYDLPVLYQPNRHTDGFENIPFIFILKELYEMVTFTI